MVKHVTRQDYLEWARANAPQDIGTFNCPTHGIREDHKGYIELFGCPVCYDEEDARMNRAWPRGCPSGYAENAKS